MSHLHICYWRDCLNSSRGYLTCYTRRFFPLNYWQFTTCTNRGDEDLLFVKCCYIQRQRGASPASVFLISSSASHSSCFSARSGMPSRSSPPYVLLFIPMLSFMKMVDSSSRFLLTCLLMIVLYADVLINPSNTLWSRNNAKSWVVYP